jgi:hypothetical protein
VRPKGWKGAPLLDEKTAGFGVKHVAHTPLNQNAAAVALGFRSSEMLKLPKGSVAFLAQEVRSPFAGKYTCRASVFAAATSRDFFENVFAKHFVCRLIYFQYTQPGKDPTHRKELAAVTFQPPWSELVKPSEPATVELFKEFLNPNPGQNFSFGLGMGVAVVVEKTSDGELELPSGTQAWLHVARVELDFVGKPRNNDVVV